MHALHRQLTLDSAAHGFLIALLGDHEQDGDGNCNHHGTGAEAGEPVVDEFHFQHLVQTDGNGVVLSLGTDDDLGQDEVHPGAHEGGDDLVDDHGLAQRQGDLGEGLPAGGTVDHGSLIQSLGNGIHVALHDVEADTGTGGVADDQSQRQLAALGQTHGLQQEVDGDHAHEAGEQGDDHAHVHVGLTQLPLDAGQAVGNGQHEEGGNHAGKAGDDEGVHERPGEVHGIRLGEELDVVVNGELSGEEAGSELTGGLTAEGVGNQPDEGDQPDNRNDRQEDVDNNVRDHLLSLNRSRFLSHYLKPSSFL